MILFQQCAISGVIGLAFHVAFKLRSLSKRAKAGNVQFSYTGYFKDDWLTLLISALSILAAYWILDEAMTLYPSIADYLKVTFIFIGYTGSSLAHLVLSRAEKKIMSVIDKKTDIADKKEDAPKQGGTTYDPN